MDTMPALKIDGPRPAFQWVASLPPRWLSAGDRAVLYVLAADTYAQQPPFECSPSMGELSSWTGDYRGTLNDRIQRLASPVQDRRPPLLEVTPGTGRRRNTYRLMTEHWSSLWSGISDHNARRSNPAEQTTPSSHDSQTTSPPSGLASVLASDPAEQATPYPLPSVVTPSSHLTQGEQHGLGGAIEELIAYGIDRATAAEMYRLAVADPETRSPSRRLSQEAYRAELLTSIRGSRRSVATDGRRCQHGVIDGLLSKTNDGTRICLPCELEHGALEVSA